MELTYPPNSERLIEMQRRLASEPELLALVSLLATFNKDELAAFLYLVQKHDAGIRKYGSLDIGNETRDFKFEGANELADFLNYQSFWWLMRVLAEKRAA